MGDVAEATFDAFERGDMFSLEVSDIALAETVRDSVPTYKTTFVIREVPEEALTLRPGMTADIDVLTDVRDATLYIPTRSVVFAESGSYVHVYEDGLFKEVPITVGLRGSEGTVEVVSGLEEGQEIVLYSDAL